MAQRTPVVVPPSTAPRSTPPDLLGEIRQRLVRQDADLETMLSRWKACEAEKVANPDELTRAGLNREAKALEAQILEARVTLANIQTELDAARLAQAEAKVAKWKPLVKAAIEEFLSHIREAELAHRDLAETLERARADLQGSPPTGNGHGWEAWGAECLWREFLTVDGESTFEFRRKWLRQNLWL